MFDEDRYFDVFVEYAKESPEDILIQITVHNRGPEAADAARPADALVPQPVVVARRRADRPTLAAGRLARRAERRSRPSIRSWATRYLYCEGDVPLLFTENETNTQRIFGVANRTPYVKDSINNYVVHGQAEAVNPEQTGTKAAAHYRLTVDAGQSRSDSAAADGRRAGRARPAATAEARSVRQRISTTMLAGAPQGGRRVLRGASLPASLSADEANVMRQALAGMLWSKQFYHYDVDKWLEERGSDPFKATRKARPAQRPLAPHVQRRRHLDAGQVGVSLVRGLGPGLPRARR